MMPFTDAGHTRDHQDGAPRHALHRRGLVGGPKHDEEHGGRKRAETDVDAK
jgi:hypothetical protein